MRFSLVVCLCAGLALWTSCSSSDCPLNNTVSSRYGFASSASGSTVTLTDTLSVHTYPEGQPLLNRMVGATQIALPVGYFQDTDTLLFRFDTDQGSCEYLIYMSHTNVPHFVSLDCSTSMFHEVTQLRWDAVEGQAVEVVDSITVTNSKINYEQVENFKVYLRER